MTIEIIVTEDDFVPTVDPTIAQLRAALRTLDAYVGILNGVVLTLDLGSEIENVARAASDTVLEARTLAARLTHE